LIHLAPLFFDLYLLTLPLPIILSLPHTLILTGIWCFPALLFAALSLGTGISAASWHRRAMDAVKVPILIFLRHFLYGVGLLAGFLTPGPKPVGDVHLFQVQWTKDSYKMVPVRKASK
jgi:hypothetical protein